MITSLSIDELAEYTSLQLNYFFPDKNKVDLVNYKDCVKTSLDKIEFCFKRVTLKNYNNGTDVLFNHLHSDHYVMYIWYLSNTIWKEKQDKNLCNKLYYLNKSLHSFDCMFDTNLPNIFLLFHCAGTMLGKATYSDYFVVLQGCTIGNNRGKYPIIQKGVALTAHASIIGDCFIGNLVTISSYTNVFDKNIDDKTIVFKNEEGQTIYKKTSNSFAQSFFNVTIV